MGNMVHNYLFKIFFDFFHTPLALEFLEYLSPVFLTCSSWLKLEQSSFLEQPNSSANWQLSSLFGL